MFEHPDEVMRQKEREDSDCISVQSISEIDSPPKLNLPHALPDHQSDGFPRIDNNVLVDVMDGKYNDKYEHVIVIDCRFQYEYDGGHINGAVNFEDKESLAEELFNKETKPNAALIFHCEYSEHRAPIM